MNTEFRHGPHHPPRSLLVILRCISRIIDQPKSFFCRQQIRSFHACHSGFADEVHRRDIDLCVFGKILGISEEKFAGVAGEGWETKMDVVYERTGYVGY